MFDAYDLLPYTEHAYAESHPDRLEVIARLSGFTTEPGRSAAPRVLELGCGRGGNLLPMASAWPEATFVGVDLSEGHIRDASRVAAAAELGNVTLVCGDFADARLDDGAFDFVLCHGVYSWVPLAARRGLLARIQGALAPAGVAYVSFNTLPGWYSRLAARDWMRFSARASLGGGPRDALHWLHRVVSPEHAGYRAQLGAVHERLLATDAAYLSHEYLAEEHHPAYVSTFLDEAADAGLSYLGDALPSESAPELAPPDVQSRAAGLDLRASLDLLDFTRDTAFRRALLVRSDTAATLGFRAPARLDSGAVRGLRVASRLRPRGDAAGSGVESFEVEGTRVLASGVARQALRALAEIAPRSIPCDELAEKVGADADVVASEIYDLWITTPGVDLHAREPQLATSLSLHPRASAVARWHAVEGGPITNVWHHEVVLPEAIVRFILGRLDGKTTAEQLIAAVRQREGDRTTGGEAEAVVEASLRLLATAGLLVG